MLLILKLLDLLVIGIVLRGLLIPIAIEKIGAFIIKSLIIAYEVSVIRTGR